MKKKIMAVVMSAVMLVMSIAVYGAEKNGYGDQYQTHSGVALYETVDYQELQSELQALCQQQEENGYTVTEMTITYIMPEAIEQWLAGKEEERFFGIPLAELEKEVGENTSFYFDENGLQAYISVDEYDWEKIAMNIGAGCGIILVGATITTLTGGSASVVIVCMVKAGITSAALSGATSLAVNTVTGMVGGMEFSEALESAVPLALEDASTGFFVESLCSGVAIQTGAKFIDGTAIQAKRVIRKNLKSITKSMEESSFKPIQRLAKFINEKTDSDLLASVKEISEKNKMKNEIVEKAAEEVVLAIDEKKIPIFLDEEDGEYDQDAVVD